MRNLQTIKMKVTQLKEADGDLTENDKDAADELCKSFRKVFVIEDNNDIIVDDLQGNAERQSNQLQDVEFTTESIYK